MSCESSFYNQPSIENVDPVYNQVDTDYYSGQPPTRRAKGKLSRMSFRHMLFVSKYACIAYVLPIIANVLF